MSNVITRRSEAGSKKMKYDAVVVDNKDPQKLQRVRVKCAPLFGNEAHPEWIRKKDSYGGTSNGSVYGSVNVQEITGRVVLEVNDTTMFSDMRWSFPSAISDEAVPTEFNKDYPTSKGIKTPGGHSLVSNDTTGEIKYTDPNGSYIEFDEIGNLSINVFNQLSFLYNKILVSSIGTGISIKDEMGATINIEAGGIIRISSSTGTDILTITNGTISLASSAINLAASSIALGVPGSGEPITKASTLKAAHDVHLHLPSVVTIPIGTVCVGVSGGAAVMNPAPIPLTVTTTGIPSIPLPAGIASTSTSAS